MHQLPQHSPMPPQLQPLAFLTFTMDTVVLQSAIKHRRATQELGLLTLDVAECAVLSWPLPLFCSSPTLPQHPTPLDTSSAHSLTSHCISPHCHAESFDCQLIWLALRIGPSQLAESPKAHQLTWGHALLQCSLAQLQLMSVALEQDVFLVDGIP